MIVYNPINWKNRAVEHKHRYEMSQAESAGLVYLTPAPGEVDEPGTPINADNLNHMDEAILAHDQKLDELEQKKVNISGGDISDTVATLDETAGDAADNIASGESLRTILGKIHKVIRQFFNHKTDTVIHTTKADKDKLAGIEEHANNYVHPDTHPAGMITSDANHRFVTDDKIESWDNSLGASKTYTDGMYRQATAYADKKVADLIGGAPESLDTLKDVADAIKENESVMDALDAAVGKKANQSELDTHVDNSTIHITSQEREKWNGSVSKTGDASNTTVTFTESTREKPKSEEKLSTIVGKIVKWLADLKTVAFSGSYNDLTNKPASLEPYFKNNTWYSVGDDCYIGDHNTAGYLCIKGNNGAPGIALYTDDDKKYAEVIHSANIGSQSVNYANSAGSVAWGDVSGRPSSLPASDVYSWAKASSKPSYVASEVGALEKLSDRTKGIGFNIDNNNALCIKIDNSLYELLWANNYSYHVLPLSGGTMKGNIYMNGNKIFLYSNTQCIEANDQDVNIISAGKSSSAGYVNARVVSAFQVRNLDNSAWRPINAMSFNTQSSKRYKKNITNMSDEDARKLLKYRVVNYDYINEMDGIGCNGLIAEEVAEIDEYPIYRTADGTIEGLDYSKFVPKLIKMIQIQQQEIDELKKLVQR